jgi:hypothetical protein
MAPLASLITVACTAWISAGSSPIGKELLEMNAATTSAACSIGSNIAVSTLPSIDVERHDCS